MAERPAEMGGLDSQLRAKQKAKCVSSSTKLPFFFYLFLHFFSYNIGCDQGIRAVLKQRLKGTPSEGVNVDGEGEESMHALLKNGQVPHSALPPPLLLPALPLSPYTHQ